MSGNTGSINAGQGGNATSVTSVAACGVRETASPDVVTVRVPVMTRIAAMWRAGMDTQEIANALNAERGAPIYTEADIYNARVRMP